ncbi:MAG: tetratricopeptide repeat protein [Acidobacteria bacterium]|nr:tetratricopeptide repeat protein [Acidobacteriota bacterium]MBK8810448.1 tetratricopeptide repeat protein [Acidobacteriota bacterium]
MKKTALLIVLICVFGVPALAQKLPKPTMTPSVPTTAQKFLMQQGIALHDNKKFDVAIQKYQLVLDENPDCTAAMYEMALSYAAKGDVDKALEIAMNGVKYKSTELSLFYILIANTWDDQGKSQDSIELYKDAIKFLKDEKNSQKALSSVYYNLGVTYARQKLYKESREALKNAVYSNFGYGSPNYLLAEVFLSGKYKVPAMLAAARFVSLELNSARAKRSAQIFLSILKSAKKDEKTGTINIFLDLDAPKDEGDFGMYDLVLGTLTTIESKKEETKSDDEIFAEAFDSLVALLSEDKKLKSTFVGKTYIRFLVELKKKGFSKVLAYLILQQDGNKTAEKWLVENGEKTKDFIDWAKSYDPSGS